MEELKIGVIRRKNVQLKAAGLDEDEYNKHIELLIELEGQTNHSIITTKIIISEEEDEPYKEKDRVEIALNVNDIDKSLIRPLGSKAFDTPASPYQWSYLFGITLFVLLITFHKKLLGPIPGYDALVESLYNYNGQ